MRTAMASLIDRGLLLNILNITYLDYVVTIGPVHVSLNLYDLYVLYPHGLTANDLNDLDDLIQYIYSMVLG